MGIRNWELILGSGYSVLGVRCPTAGVFPRYCFFPVSGLLSPASDLITQNQVPCNQGLPMWKIPQLPEHYQSFFLSIIFSMVLPLLPLLLELLQTEVMSGKSLTLYASIYSVSIGAQTRSKLIFGIAIMGSIFFASLFGLAAGVTLSYTDYRFLAIIYIILLSLIHCSERWNRHLFEKKPFLQFLSKK